MALLLELVTKEFPKECSPPEESTSGNLSTGLTGSGTKAVLATLVRSLALLPPALSGPLLGLCPTGSKGALRPSQSCSRASVARAEGSGLQLKYCGS